MNSPSPMVQSSEQRRGHAQRRVETGLVVGKEAAGPFSGGFAGSGWLGVWYPQPLA